MYIKMVIEILLLSCVGCKDIDDALHCTALPNGNFEVGVRILKPGGVIFYYFYFYFLMPFIEVPIDSTLDF